MDQLTGILAFVRTAESRSFAQAARLLDVTPSGVSKSVARLEAQLGLRLLHRTTRQVSLTDDGAVFFEHCRRLLDDFDAARSLMSDRAAAPSGRLRVSVPSTLGKLFVVPRLPQFLAARPDVTLELDLSDRQVALVDERVDVAVRIGTLVDSSLVARPLWTQQVVTIASPGYLQDSAALATLGDLARHRCLSFRWPTNGRERPWMFRCDGRAVQLRPRVHMMLDEGEAMVVAVRAGLGVAQVPDYMAADAIGRGEAVEVLAGIRPPPTPINAVYASQRNLPARTRAFVDWLATLPGPAPLPIFRAPARRRARRVVASA